MRGGGTGDRIACNSSADTHHGKVYTLQDETNRSACAAAELCAVAGSCAPPPRQMSSMQPIHSPNKTPTNVFNAADRPPARSPKCHTSISAHETATEVIVRAVSIVAGICKLHHYGRKYSTRLLVCRDQVFLECSMSTWRLGETESCVSVLMSYFQIWY